MQPEHQPRKQGAEIPEEPSPLIKSSLPRRDFLRQLSAIISSASHASKLASVLEQSDSLSGDLSFERFKPIKEAIEQCLSADSAIRKRLDPFSIFHKARKAIAEEFSIVENTPVIGEGKARQAVAKLMRCEQNFLGEAFSIRSTALSYLHDNYQLLHQFVEYLFEENHSIELGRLSAALAHENAHASPDTVRRIISSENHEISYLFNETLTEMGDAAVKTTNLYQTRAGINIHRQMDGSFKLTADKKWDELATKRIEEHTLPEIAPRYSPELYRFSFLPPSRFSLQVEHPGFQRELDVLFTSRIEEIMSQEKIPLSVRAQFAECHIDTVVSSVSTKATKYLSLLEEIHYSTTPDTLLESPLSKWIHNPRTTLAKEVITPYAPFMGKIKFDSLKGTPSFLGIQFKSHTISSYWSGPLEAEKSSRIFHDILGESITELLDEQKLFFCNLPVLNLDHFKQCAKMNVSSSHFAEMFLPVIDRLMVKKINIIGFLLAK